MTSPKLDLRRLRYFQMVATHGSFSGAARALNLSQPALTHHVGELERTFGILLLERSHKGAELTLIGRRLLRHAEIIFDEVARAEADLVDLMRAQAVGKPLRIVILPSIADTLTAPLIAELNARFPDRVARISEAHHNSCHSAVSAGKVDLAVTLPDPAWPDGELLGSEPLYFVTKAHSGADADTCEPIHFAEVVRHPMILPSSENVTRLSLEKTASDMGLTIIVAAEVNGFVPRKEAVIAGLGSTILPRADVSRDILGGLLSVRPIIEPPLSRQLILRWRADLDPETVAAVRGMLQDLLARRSTIT